MYTSFPCSPIALHLQASLSSHGSPDSSGETETSLSLDRCCLLAASIQCSQGGQAGRGDAQPQHPPSSSRSIWVFPFPSSIWAQRTRLPDSPRGLAFFPIPRSPTVLPASLAGILHCAEEQGTKCWWEILCNS